MKNNILALAVLSALTLNANAEFKTNTIDVFSPGPLPSIGLDVSIVPGSIQVIKSKDIEKQAGSSLADYLVNNAEGVSINEIGGNPWQPEISFRGYSAGSVVGNSQGVSVFVDGVRENQPFGEVVLWDTIPMWAISGTQVVAGSNPIYGLNTLGGALALQTKNGKEFNKGRLSVTGGSWDRTSGLVEYGGVIEESKVDYYVGYNHTSENGWRKHSPSHLNQFFSKIGKDYENGRMEISYTAASNNLMGNGLTPKFLLGADNEGIHSLFDLTENRYNKLNVNFTQYLSEVSMLSANAYYVQSNRYTYNGDLEFTDTDDDGLIDPGTETEGTINQTRTKQDKYGLSLQYTLTDSLFGKENHFVAGTVLETSLINYQQWAYDEQNVIAGNRLVELSDPSEYSESTNLSGRNKLFGLYAVDTLSLNKEWHLTGGLRYNYSQVDNSDRLNGDSASSSLTAKQGWGRINPNIGLTFKPNDRYSTFVSYSESNRAPSSIELGCSNPNNPCLLPTQMADDPPLRDVVSKTYEIGARGKFDNRLAWNATIYHAYNHDDIQFVYSSAAGNTSMGYFDNIGRTRRDGIDIGLTGNGLFGLDNSDNFNWATSYGFVHATYDSDLTLVSEVNTSNDDGDISVKKGDQLANIPQHRLKLRLDYNPTSNFRIGSNLVAFSKAWVMGNENQKHDGDGEIPGYAIVNLDANYQFNQKWNLTFKAINILDKNYYTGGRLMQTAVQTDGALGDAGDPINSITGVVPGSPQAAWLTLSYDFK